MSDYMTAQFHEKVRELAVLRREMERLLDTIGYMKSELSQRDAALDVLRGRIEHAMTCLSGESCADPGSQRGPKSLAAVQAEVRQSRSQVSQPPLTPGETQ